MPNKQESVATPEMALPYTTIGIPKDLIDGTFINIDKNLRKHPRHGSKLADNADLAKLVKYYGTHPEQCPKKLKNNDPTNSTVILAFGSKGKIGVGSKISAARWSEDLQAFETDRIMVDVNSYPTDNSLVLLNV